MKGLIGGLLAAALVLAPALAAVPSEMRIAQAMTSQPAQGAPKVKAVKTPAPSAQAAAPASTAAPASPVPPVEIVVLMMRASIIALDQANKTNNYTVLRALSGPGLQAHTAEELSKTFEVLRTKQIDLSPVLVTKPRMTANPTVLANGNLHLTAIFPTKPLSIACIVEMQPVAGFWRLAGITINLVPAEADAAPAAGAAAAPKQ